MEPAPARGHARIETSNLLMIVLILIVVAIGGMVEIIPLFFQRSTTEPTAGRGNMSDASVNKFADQP